jgi:hypothetical protein
MTYREFTLDVRRPDSDTNMDVASRVELVLSTPMLTVREEKSRSLVCFEFELPEVGRNKLAVENQ